MYILAPLTERHHVEYLIMLARANFTHHLITKREAIEVVLYWSHLLSHRELIDVFNLFTSSTAKELMTYNGELAIQISKIYLYLLEQSRIENQNQLVDINSSQHVN